MGKSNRTAALENKISFLLAERAYLRTEIERAEALIGDLPNKEERHREVEELIKACELVIRSDHPDWTPEHLTARRVFRYQSPVRLGQATKIALDVLRIADKPLTVREIAEEVLRREGDDSPVTDTITRLANNIGNQFRKRNRPYLADDGGWPIRWWIKKGE